MEFENFLVTLGIDLDNLDEDVLKDARTADYDKMRDFSFWWNIYAADFETAEDAMEYYWSGKIMCEGAKP